MKFWCHPANPVRICMAEYENEGVGLHICYASKFTPTCPFREEIPENMSAEDLQKMYDTNAKQHKAIEDFLNGGGESGEPDSDELVARRWAADFPEVVRSEYIHCLKSGEPIIKAIALAMEYVEGKRSIDADARFDSQPTRCGHSLRSDHDRGWRGGIPLRTPCCISEEDA